MSDNTVNIRPHHALCAAFFEGKGYSSEFTENMDFVTDRLEKENPVITLTSEADIICGKCPENNNGICNSGGRSERYDKTVLEMCGLGFGDKLKWKELSEAAENEIIRKGRLREVCGGCRWNYICLEKADNIR